MGPSNDQLTEIGEEVRRAVEVWPGAILRWQRVEEGDDFVSVGVEVADFDDLAASLVRRFGGSVDVLRVEYRERAHPFEVWWLDEVTLELTVQCTCGRDDIDCRLEIVETSERVEATAFVGSRTTTTRSSKPTPPGRPRRGRSLVGYAKEASVQLAEPLGGRELIDTYGGTGRTRYSPPREPTAEEIAYELERAVPEPDHPTERLSPEEMEASWARTRDLADRARPYLMEHRAALAGSEFRQYPWGVCFVATFSRDVRTHREALHPEIWVRHADHSQLDFEQMQRDAVALLEGLPGGGWSTCRRWYFGDLYDTVFVEGYADDPESARAQLEARFGDTVRLLLQDGATHRPALRPFVGYAADDDAWVIAVKRDSVTGPAFLLLEEDDPDQVTVRLLCSEPLPADEAGRTLESTGHDGNGGFREPQEWVIAHLRDGPLDGRRVIDAADGQPRPQITPQT